MTISDITSVAIWWMTFFVIGVLFFPFVARLFSNFFDKGYIFSKILGTAIISYTVFVIGILHLFPFSQYEVFGVLIGFLILTSIFLMRKLQTRDALLIRQHLPWIIFEEILFFAALSFWAFVKIHQPDIHGLEKFMDFGFINSILRSSYFPPRDMWYTPEPINYYYFGHFTTAVLTKLSGLPSAQTFNLMLSTIFAFCFTGAFSIGGNLVNFLLQSLRRGDATGGPPSSARREKSTEDIGWGQRAAGPHRRKRFVILCGGLLTAFLLTFAGNLHILYAFFKPYQNDYPVPLWKLAFSPLTFPNNYWYPNATRFIFHTIHEFPSYSFVVSDLHGHVLDIPFVLLMLAVLFSLISKSKILNTKQITKSNTQNSKRFGHWTFANLDLFRNSKLEISNLLLVGFLLAIMYMTNAWDGIIYFGLTFIIITSIAYHQKNLLKEQVFRIMNYELRIKQTWSYLLHTTSYILLTLLSFIFFVFPFSLNFHPEKIASGIGINCAPTFLTNLGHIGPFLFEPNHCMHSPLWQLATLYGFFYFFAISFLIFLYVQQKKKKEVLPSDSFILILIAIATLLILIPEFVYLKDIYDTYFRANTMFKMVYQAYILLSICSGYIFLRLVLCSKYSVLRIQKRILFIVYILLSTCFIILVLGYSYFATSSYFDNLKTSYSLDGTTYLHKLYPTDAAAITWINQNITGQPIILEAQGDSYTDYARVSANTGLPTVFGWTVHEWLWRGTYDIAPPRIADIQTLYETTNLQIAKNIIKKYKISLIFIGDLERKKYRVAEDKFSTLGKIIYQNGETTVYALSL